MVRRACCEKIAGMKKGRWTAEEDDILSNYIHAHGEGLWRSLPKTAGLLRCGKSCRMRWINYLKPGTKRGKFTTEEETIIVKLYASLGSRWSMIATHLPGRTDNDLKNYWNSHLSRKMYCFRHTLKNTIKNNTKHRVVQRPTTKKKLTGKTRTKKNIPPMHDPVTPTNDHKRQEKIDLESFEHNNKGHQNEGDNGEKGSISNKNNEVVFPNFEEDIEHVDWDYIGNLSPIVYEQINWDFGIECYFDQSFKELEAEGEVWPWLWDDNESNYPILW